jgi:opacity protein-like surface antigen
MSKSIIVIPIAALLMASTGWAEGPAPDYGRPGWYVGVGGGGAWDFLDDAVQDATGSAVEFDGGGTFNARGGYRATSWFAFELMYEGNYNMGVTFLGADVADFDSHSIYGNFKFIVPTWRIHPYLAIGPGAQYGKFNGKGLVFDPFDTNRWDFALRFGLGVDGYITENWLLNLEVAPSIRFADYTNIPSETTDNVSLTFSVGIQYRF